MKQPVLEDEHHVQDSQASIHVRRGNLYFHASLYERYFADLHSAILMRKADVLCILPVVNTNAGGLLMKIRNAQGDRVIHAQEFFRNHAIDEQFEEKVPVAWDSASACLRVHLPPSAFRDETQPSTVWTGNPFALEQGNR